VALVSFQFHIEENPDRHERGEDAAEELDQSRADEIRTPSASDMIREMRTPVLVESKYEIGKRRTCAWTRLRISVIARCAATLTTCESANDVAA